MPRKTGVKRASGPRNGFGRPWPTLVMPKCGKLRAFPPCAVGHFMSNIKMFPMALLPGWPFAPKQDSRRQDSLNIDSLNKRSRVHPADVRFDLPVGDV